jgi:F-type H+-transporting ATPase subunit delta
MDKAFLKGLQTSVPGRYARALFEVASEQKESRAILTYLGEFNTACMGDAHVRKTMPFLSEADFAELLKPLVTTYGWPRYLVHFFSILHSHQRFSFFKAILDIFEKCCDHADGHVNARISTPIMPTKSHMKKIQDMVLSVFGKNVSYEYESISDLLGGVVIQADNLRIDASLKHNMNQLEKQLNDITLKGAA